MPRQRRPKHSVPASLRNRHRGAGARFALVIAFSAKSLGKAFDVLGKVEKWAASRSREYTDHRRGNLAFTEACLQVSFV